MDKIEHYEYFIDNYRSFNKTFLKLSQVTFLVGENSTGKSSILEVIQLFGEEDFWFHLRPDRSSAIFRRYTNFSTNNENQEYPPLRLGFLYSGPSVEKYKCIIMEFAEENNTPRLRRVLFSYKKNVVSYDTGSNILRKKSLKKSKGTDINDLVLKNLIIDWTDENQAGWENEEKVNFDPPIFGPIIFNIDQVQASEDGFKVQGSSLKRAPYFEGKTFLFDPLRARPKKYYEIEPETEFSYKKDGGHTPFALARISQKSTEVLREIEKFGEMSGMFENIAVEKISNEPDSPIKLSVRLGGETRNLTQVGYGVSQVLPIICQIIIHIKVVGSSCVFLIQQPEVHLHPKAQALFGEFVFEIAQSNQNVIFVIETHSDYVIDRFKTCMKKCQEWNDPLAKICFFLRSNKDNKVYQLKIDSNGDFIDEVPKEYREFFIEEEKSILGF